MFIAFVKRIQNSNFYTRDEIRVIQKLMGSSERNGIIWREYVTANKDAQN